MPKFAQNWYTNVKNSQHQPLILSWELCWWRVAKKQENRNLNRKTDITWYQSISEIGPNGLKLICETKIAWILCLLFTTLQIQLKWVFSWNGQISINPLSTNFTNWSNPLNFSANEKMGTKVAEFILKNYFLIQYSWVYFLIWHSVRKFTANM